MERTQLRVAAATAQKCPLLSRCRRCRTRWLATVQALRAAAASVRQRSDAHRRGLSLYRSACRHQAATCRARPTRAAERSAEHTSELQQLMLISSAAFCLKKKIEKITQEWK